MTSVDDLALALISLCVPRWGGVGEVSALFTYSFPSSAESYVALRHAGSCGPGLMSQPYKVSINSIVELYSHRDRRSRPLNCLNWLLVKKGVWFSGRGSRSNNSSLPSFDYLILFMSAAFRVSAASSTDSFHPVISPPCFIPNFMSINEDHVDDRASEFPQSKFCH